ncbi:hypothetical protein RKD32_007361 [Streptomyces sp. SAI-195]
MWPLSGWGRGSQVASGLQVLASVVRVEGCGVTWAVVQMFLNDGEVVAGASVP